MKRSSSEEVECNRLEKEAKKEYSYAAMIRYGVGSGIGARNDYNRNGVFVEVLRTEEEAADRLICKVYVLLAARAVTPKPLVAAVGLICQARKTVTQNPLESLTKVSDLLDQHEWPVMLTIQKFARPVVFELSGPKKGKDHTGVLLIHEVLRSGDRVPEASIVMAYNWASEETGFSQEFSLQARLVADTYLLDDPLKGRIVPMVLSMDIFSGSLARVEERKELKSMDSSPSLMLAAKHLDKVGSLSYSDLLKYMKNAMTTEQGNYSYIRRQVFVI